MTYSTVLLNVSLTHWRQKCNRYKVQVHCPFKRALFLPDNLNRDPNPDPITHFSTVFNTCTSNCSTSTCHITFLFTPIATALIPLQNEISPVLFQSHSLFGSLALYHVTCELKKQLKSADGLVV